MKYELPETDDELIRSLQEEYTAAQNTGSEQLQDVQLRLAWAFVHAKDTTKIQRGMDMAEELLSIDGEDQRDLLYFIAVGLYRQHYYLAARTQIGNVIQRWPNFRQAIELKGLIDDGIVRDGIIGIGLGIGAVAVFGVGIVTALFARR